MSSDNNHNLNLRPAFTASVNDNGLNGGDVALANASLEFTRKLKDMAAELKTFSAAIDVTQGTTYIDGPLWLSDEYEGSKKPNAKMADALNNAATAMDNLAVTLWRQNGKAVLSARDFKSLTDLAGSNFAQIQYSHPGLSDENGSDKPFHTGLTPASGEKIAASFRALAAEVKASLAVAPERQSAPAPYQRLAL